MRTCLIGFLDDFSRKVLHAEFYWHQDLVSLATAAKKALVRAGLPENIYVDHGKIYLSRRFRSSAAEPDIYIMTGKTYHPEGMMPEETEQYIHHQMKIVGADPHVFSDAAINKIHRNTNGIPRRINNRCRNALLDTYMRDRTIVEAQIIDRIINDFANDIDIAD